MMHDYLIGCSSSLRSRSSSPLLSSHLVDTIAPAGMAIAVTGYIMNENGTGRTKHPRRIEWTDIVRQWARQLSLEDVRRAKRRLPITPMEAAKPPSLMSMPGARSMPAQGRSPSTMVQA